LEKLIQKWMRLLVNLKKSHSLVEIGYITVERDTNTNARKWTMNYYADNTPSELEPGANLIIPPQMWPEGTTIFVKVNKKYANGNGIGI